MPKLPPLVQPVRDYSEPLIFPTVNASPDTMTTIPMKTANNVTINALPAKQPPPHVLPAETLSIGASLLVPVTMDIMIKEMELKLCVSNATINAEPVTIQALILVSLVMELIEPPPLPVTVMLDSLIMEPLTVSVINLIFYILYIFIYLLLLGCRFPC